MIEVGLAANLACILEATARKPGNVHRSLDFTDLSYVDFLVAAAAIARPMASARSVGLGRTILEAVEAARSVVSTNANLGIVLLLAPLAKADRPDRQAVAQVLRETTVDDARLAYQAIRRAAPGGLGSVSDQDVRAEPTVNLREAMALAADRDAVARQYVHDFADVFQARELVGRLRGQEWPIETIIIFVFMDLLSRLPDTLIERKLGPVAAREASGRASAVLEAGWPGSARDRLAEFDAWLRADGHRRNPGATADLVAAALFLALLDGTIPLPGPGGPAAWSGRDDLPGAE